jgi:PilZ domain-containing protein
MTEPPPDSENDRTVPNRILSGFKRRAAVRYPCCAAGSSRTVEPPGGDALETWVVNISATGIGLLLRWQPEPKAELVVCLEGTAANSPHELMARVVHVLGQAQGTWYVGCQLANTLSEAELQTLLAVCGGG